MKKFRRVVCLMSILLMTVFLFAGCSSADSADSAAGSGTVISEDSSESYSTDNVEESSDSEEQLSAEEEDTLSDSSQEGTTSYSEEELQAEEEDVTVDAADYVEYTFRNDKLLTQHYEKHGIEMGFESKEEYQQAASDVVNNPDALHKTEAEDGDDVYYVEDTNEFVIVSGDGYLRTYFNPSAGKDYYDRQ